MVITVVDGHTDFLQLVKTHLRRVVPDAEIRIFAAHQSFTEFLSTQATLDLVILDETDLNKHLEEFITEIRAVFPKVPIILFSSKHFSRSEVEKMSAATYVDKSKIADLVRAVQNLMVPSSHLQG